METTSPADIEKKKETSGHYFPHTKEMKPVVYEPTEQDIRLTDEIRQFLNETEIPYEEDKEIFGLFHLNEGKLQLRYVNSAHHGIDNTKRYGKGHEGIDKDYFVNISQWNVNRDIRTIWIFDFEMLQTNPAVDLDGKTLNPRFRRQWEVIKNTVRTATGHIRHRFYARDCEVREIGNDLLRPFLDRNCFYGYRSANKNLGLFLKKDKGGFKKGTLVMVYTYGFCYFSNKKHQEDPAIEIIRVSTLIGCQVIGGASKCLKHFLRRYQTLNINGREVEVDRLIFYCDASHNDGRAMSSSALGFNFVEWKGGGFMNVFLEDVDEVYERPDGKKIAIKGKKGDIQHRKPLAHKRIMELIRDHKIVSVPNAGTSVWTIRKSEYPYE